MTREGYLDFLNEDNFNAEQIALILNTRNQFESFEKEFEREERCLNTLDGWEKDQWYTFNQSGLFEDIEENLSGITAWEQEDTRRYITEVEINNPREVYHID
jgi:hypothetical protein